jgi:hypothetical protein
MSTIQNSEAEHSHAPGVSPRFFRRLFSWRVMRRCLFVVACVATLTGLLYAVENWRGKRAWEKCRRELEAKGEVLDWNAYIPAPVPDDQNIFKAPRMTEWFVKGSIAAAVSSGPAKSPDTNAPFSLAPHNDAKAGPVLVAEVDVILSDGPLPTGKADVVLRFDDPAAREQAAKLLGEAIGPCVEGALTPNMLIARPLDQIKPVHLVLQADTVPTAKALAEFLPRRPMPHKVYDSNDPDYFQVDPAGSNAFRVSLKPTVHSAADYLAWTQPLVPDFDMIRKALERPYARIDCDYTRPYEQAIPHFVRLRTVVQILSQRAQCYLLLGQPEAAWHELALVHDICHLLEAKPTGQPMTLVAAMIHVAISGLYVNTLHDGLRLQAWREPELAVIQQQLADIKLIPELHRSFQAERAGTSRAFEIAPLPELFGFYRQGFWEKLKHPLSWLSFQMPRGWIYQNMCVGAPLEQGIIEAFDVTNDQVRPDTFQEYNRQVESTLKRHSPYTWLVAMALPNFTKAAQTTGHNQTLANEAYLACGLERYRLAHGQYPETLEALVPQFAEKVPHDIIGGQSLKYHRTADGQFVLYSVGWNEKDDGGVPGKTIADGDWVWP